MSQEIAIIVTIKSVAETARRVVQGQGLDIPVRHCFLEEAQQAAAELAEQGVKVFVSMGITADMIRQRTGAPVLKIQYSGLDCAVALQQAFAHSGKVAALGSDSLRHQIRRACRFLGREIPEFDLRQDLPARTQVEAVMGQGYTVIVSGSPVSDLTDALGGTGVCVALDERTVELALQNARTLLGAINDSQEKHGTIHAILSSTSEGIVCTDHSGDISYMNPAAQHMLGRGGGTPEKEIGQLLRDGTAAGGQGLVVTGSTPILVDGRATGSVHIISRVSTIQRLEQHIRRELLAKGHVARTTFDDIVGHSPPILEAVRIARRYARFDSTVLLMGESGTGKELFAQSIHNGSGRAAEAFVAVNCAALPEHLLESELFGYVKGAFTGARQGGKTGLFEMAHDGTIFLDEIGDLPLPMQAKLLRVLQEGEFTRIGDDRVIKCNVRVLCATNRDLLRMVAEGRFREDLYYRLSVLELTLPPLRERLADVGALCGAIIAGKNQALGTGIRGITPELERRLKGLPWPGNVRELGNLLERMMVVCEEDMLHSDLLDAVYRDSAAPAPEQSGVRRSTTAPRTLRDAETEAILEALRRTGGNRTRAAGLLGIGVSTLWRRLKELEAAGMLPAIQKEQSDRHPD